MAPKVTIEEDFEVNYPGDDRGIDYDTALEWMMSIWTVTHETVWRKGDKSRLRFTGELDQVLGFAEEMYGKMEKDLKFV